jgi:hypothetical protein
MNFRYVHWFHRLSFVVSLLMSVTCAAAATQKDDIEAVQVRILKGVFEGDKFQFIPATTITPDGSILSLECDYRYVALAEPAYDRSKWLAKFGFAGNWMKLLLQGGKDNPNPALGDVVTLRTYVFVIDDLKVVRQSTNGYIEVDKLEVGKQTFTCELDENYALAESDRDNNRATTKVEVLKKISHSASLEQWVPRTSIVAPELVFIGAYPPLSAKLGEGSASAAIESKVVPTIPKPGAAPPETPSAVAGIPALSKGTPPAGNASQAQTALQPSTVLRGSGERAVGTADANLNARAASPSPPLDTTDPQQAPVTAGTAQDVNLGGRLPKIQQRESPSASRSATSFPPDINHPTESIAKVPGRPSAENASSQARPNVLEQENRFSMTPELARAVAPASQPMLLNVEGEDLVKAVKIQVAGGQVTAQPMAGFGAGWSGDGQLFWSGGAVGAVLDLLVDIPAAATYAMELYPTRAPDYGQVKIQVDGQDAPATLDGYSPRVMAPTPRQIGKFALGQGQRKISFMIVGKNRSASGYLVGIDRIRLYPVGP